ncbi:MAG: hypothetical protein ACD_39C00636G0005 [uncultured bacterium]|nr:MAG: hypothetical protein ACD_39C00636G0005 [uncultured bacterium]
MNLLIITYEYQGQVALPNYPDTIKQLNPTTSIVVYQRLYEKLGHRGFNRYIKQLIDDEKIEAVFCLLAMDFEIHADFLAELRQKTLVALYFGDDCTYYDMHFKYLCQGADFVFTNIIYAESKYLEIGIPAKFLVPAFDVSQVKPLNLERDIDVSFIGMVNNRVGRARYINHLIKHGIRVETYGAGTENGPVSQEKKLEIYNRSKINLDFTGLSEFTVYTLDYPIYARKKHPKGRSLEIALSRSFLLSENAPGIEHYLTPGKEIAVFNDENDILEKVQYYLTHTEEREKLANNAYERALRDNDLHKQCQMVLDLLKTRITEKKQEYEPIILGRDYERNYATYRLFHFMRFMKKLQFSFAMQELALWLKKPRIDLVQAIFYLGECFPIVHKIRKAFQSIWKPYRK